MTKGTLVSLSSYNLQCFVILHTSLLLIFQYRNTDFAKGLTQPLTEMSTSNISWGYRRPVCRTDNLTTFMGRLLKSGSLNLLEPSGPVQACNGITLPYTHTTAR